MTKEYAIQILREMIPKFARCDKDVKILTAINMAIKALSEERKTGRWNDETKQKIYELECENRILMNCLAEAFTMEIKTRLLIRQYNRLIEAREDYDDQVGAFEDARREYDRFEERKAMGKIVNVNEDVPRYDVEPESHCEEGGAG